MSSRSNGLLSTVLMLAPLLAVPLLAIFGIPQFVPVVASTTTENTSRPASPDFITDVGESANYTPDGLITPFSRMEEPACDARPRSCDYANGPNDWKDPFQANGADQEKCVPNTLAKGGNSILAMAITPTQVFESDAPFTDSWSDAFDGWKPKTDHWIQIPVRTETAPAAGDAQPRRQRVIQTVATQPGEINTANNRAHFSTTGTPAVEMATVQQAGERTAVGNSDMPLTWQKAVERLNVLGIRQFQLLPGDRKSSFYFSCFYTAPDNPRVTHRFEAEANAPLKAVENVLAQIDRWAQPL